ncbi:hypothetical protein [Polynucleobacter sp. UK-Gri1-W3]|uniref:hypothetical protein n=1 Tax=Polynucleobacter sp. UK-Gri1-W3 TaxID=1819737 RepID=UPI001C0CC0F2|nr:hypothetical protein [Polynucleobacter sp. UK-Gri1-W3]MBU3539050.1 hypothetical protein [Polynucleobacter sp. UK-Gri1-W3]
MNLKLIPLCIAAIFTLSACDKLGSFGFSLDKTESTSSDQSKSITKDRSIGVSDSNQFSVKMPAAALIAESMRDFLAQQGIKPPFRKAFIGSGSATLSGKVSTSTLNPAYVAAALAISASYEPALAWPSFINDHDFMIRGAAMSDFANSISTEIVSKISSQALQNPDDAKAKIILELGKIPSATLEAIYSKALAGAKASQLTQNLAGSSSPIEYKIGDSAVSAGSNGFQVAKNGLTWFGGGALSGKSYDISMSSSLSTALNQRLDLNTKESSGSSETAKISADIKH